MYSELADQQGVRKIHPLRILPIEAKKRMYKRKGKERKGCITLLSVFTVDYVSHHVIERGTKRYHKRYVVHVCTCLISMPPLKKGAYCFATIGRSVGMSVCRPGVVQSISFDQYQTWYTGVALNE